MPGMLAGSFEEQVGSTILERIDTEGKVLKIQMALVKKSLMLHQPNT